MSKSQEAALCAEAEKQGTTVSALINRLLMFGEETKRVGEVRIEARILDGILSCASEEDLAEAGRKFGETFPKTYLNLINRACDFGSCYYLLTKLMRDHSNWYDVKIEETPVSSRFTLLDSNKLGKRWLKFVGEYAAAMVHSVLNVEAKMSIHDDRILLEVPKPHNV
jgi:hypothetical protein